jgi:murein DD-endopeptidase MepM/ murein hydrolase activator NlpD
MNEQRTKRRYHLIVGDRDSSRSLVVTFHTGHLRLLGAMALLLLIALNVMLYRTMSSSLLMQRSQTLRQERNYLETNLQQAHNEMGSVLDLAADLSATDWVARIQLNLSPLSQDVRAAGVGGATPVEGWLVGDSRIEELQELIDRALRVISVQRQSFDEIESAMDLNEDRVRHTPGLRPASAGHLSEFFGYRNHPFTGRRQFHKGIDISAPTGTPVYATADGVVMTARVMGNFGNVIKVDHGYGYVSIYGHLDEIHVRRGQRVSQGEVIGTIGNTGRSTASHLHYEIRLQGRPVDPLDYFNEGFALANGELL